ncbi:Cytosolic sorting protein GGA2/TOM1 protein [Dioscorea alata]|uniref:Cytosolic sorting protein GGA2/TOM1 protein n=1 Tax=Dioscorea alata TaxID=55571 RepID=A0ACB7V2F5_DIOAL|nr:Cytosolic sorting protein GGA2/TOM1 protein [Dioscorea alata]
MFTGMAPAPAGPATVRVEKATVRVEKATSDLLIGPDWTMNMDICDSINSDHWQAKEVVKAMKKRLQHKNPRVQFLTLTLLETMIKNCGDSVHHQVAERDILQEMIKIVRKKTDMQVRDKILVLLDSWQEAFGGPGGKYPQYFLAYSELKRFGVVFPKRSADSALIFTPPATHATAIPRQIQANFGMPNNSSIRLDEAMASEMANLSLVDLDGIQTAMELLSEMLRAVNPSDHEAVKDEVIMDLVSQCRSNQKRVLQLINATGDEELLGRALTLNDRLQSVLIKHEAIASGSPLPIEASASSPAPSAPLRPPSPVELNQIPIEEEEEEDEDDEFIQLARRNEKFKPAATETSNGLETNGQLVPISTTATEAEASSSAISNALALPDPPAPVKTTKEQDMIDLLSLTLVTNPSSQPQTPLTPSSTASASSNGHGYSYNPQPYIGNQAYTPYNSYIAPWAQPLSPPLPPQPAQPLSPQPPLQPQVQVPQYESSYPPPPWATSTTYQVPSQAPIQQYQRNDTPAYNRFDHHQQVNASASANQRAPMTGTPPKPYVPPYRLFEDLIDLRNPDGSVKVRNTPPSLSGARK